MTGHDLDGYITKRVIAVDAAQADGSYADWPEIPVDLPVEHLAVLRLLARRNGVTLSDLIAAIAERDARVQLMELLA